MPITSDCLHHLEQLNRPALAIRWQQAFGVPAPSVQSTLLRGALAWRCQVTDEGKVEVDKLLRRLRKVAKSQASSATLTPGTRLLRDWQGKTHHVLVVTTGFEYAGTTYKSLSAIARHITGTPWSGPLFFGLRK